MLSTVGEPRAASGGAGAGAGAAAPHRLSFAEHFRQGGEIGHGSFGYIHECIPNERGGALLRARGGAFGKLVVKTIMRARSKVESDNVALNLKREIAMYEAAWAHPNVTRCFGIFDDVDASTGGETMRIVLECASGPEKDGRLFADWTPLQKHTDLGAPGDFFRYVATRGGLDEKVARFVMYQLVAAVETLHLHEPPQIHRDLKVENSLCFGEHAVGASRTLIPVVKVSDFGTSRSIKTGEANTVSWGGGASVLGQAIRWIASFVAEPPEILRKGREGYVKAEYGVEFDCYGLGALLYATLSGGYGPFHAVEGESNPHLEARAAAGPVAATWDQLTSYRAGNGHAAATAAVSAECLDLLKRLITTSKDGRLSTTQTLDHAWFQDATFRAELAEFYTVSGLCATGIPERPKASAAAAGGAGGAAAKH